MKTKLIEERPLIDENDILTEKKSARDKPPILLFPGLMGAGPEFAALMKNIEKTDSERPLYYTNYPFDEMENINSLEGLAELYVSQILEQFKEKNEPLLLILIGYSFGGLVASHVTYLLQTKYHWNIELVILDTDLNKHIALKKNETDESLIEITNMIAKLLSLKGNFALEEEDEKKNIDEKIKNLFKQFYKVSNDSNTTNQLKKAEKNLLLSVKYNLKDKINNVSIISASKEKHTNSDLGWGEFITKKIEPKTIKTDHFSLINNQFARSQLVKFLRSEIIPSAEIITGLKCLIYLIEETKLFICEEINKNIKDINYKDKWTKMANEAFLAAVDPIKKCLMIMTNTKTVEYTIDSPRKIEDKLCQRVKKIIQYIKQNAENLYDTEGNKLSAIIEFSDATNMILTKVQLAENLIEVFASLEKNNEHYYKLKN